MKIRELTRIVIGKVGNFLSENFPDCDILLIVRPRDGESAFSISSVDPEKSYHIAQEFIDRNGTWQDVPVDDQTIN